MKARDVTLHINLLGGDMPGLWVLIMCSAGMNASISRKTNRGRFFIQKQKTPNASSWSKFEMNLVLLVRVGKAKVFLITSTMVQ